MGISDKISQVSNQLQDSIRSSSISLGSIFLKLITSLVIAMTLSIVIQELMNTGTFTFIFTMIVFTSGFLRLMKSWLVSQVLLFDLFCILVALVLKLYLQVAP
jgi:hypothetical protein